VTKTAFHCMTFIVIIIEHTHTHTGIGPQTFMTLNLVLTQILFNFAKIILVSNIDRNFVKLRKLRCEMFRGESLQDFLLSCCVH
jgi:hypothetical protein